MRVPTYDSPQVRQAALGAPRLNLDTRGTYGEAINEGTQNLARGFSSATNDIGRVVEQELDKANSIAVEGGLAKYLDAANQELNDDVNGLTRKQGEAAFGEDEKVLTRLGTLQQDIRTKGLHNDTQRADFDARVARLRLQTRERVENHIGRERERHGQSVLKSSMASSLDAITSAVTDPTAAAALPALRARPEELLRKLAPSKEEGEARVEAWRKQVHAASLEALLTAQDYEGADAYFQGARREMGVEANKWARTLDTATKGVRAEKAARSAANAHRDTETGWLDVGPARAVIEAQEEGPERDEALRRFDALARKEVQQRKADIDTHYTGAFTAFLEGGETVAAIPPEERDWLTRNAPEKWADLMNRERSRQRFERAGASGSGGGSRGGETPEQTQALIALKLEMVADPAKFRGMSAEALTSEYGHLLSGAGYKAAGTALVGLQRKAEELETKGERIDRPEFQARVRAHPGFLQLGNNKKAQAAVLAHMMTWYGEQKDKGQEPSREQFTQALGDAFQLKEVSSFFGLGTKKVPGFMVKPEAKPAAPPPARQPTPGLNLAVPPASGGKLTPGGKPYARKQKNPSTGALRYLDAAGNVVE